MLSDSESKWSWRKKELEKQIKERKNGDREIRGRIITSCDWVERRFGNQRQKRESLKWMWRQ